MENTTTPAVTTTSVGVRYGLLIGIASTILSLILYATDLEQNTAARWLSYVIMGAGIYLAHQFFKQQHKGFMSYGQGLGIGSVIGVVSGIIGGLYIFLYANFINPDYLVRALDKVRADMEARGGMSDEQIEQGLQMAAMFLRPPLFYIFAVLVTLLSAFVLALIISAFTKHKRPEFE